MLCQNFIIFGGHIVILKQANHHSMHRLPIQCPGRVGDSQGMLPMVHTHTQTLNILSTLNSLAWGRISEKLFPSRRTPMRTDCANYRQSKHWEKTTIFTSQWYFIGDRSLLYAFLYNFRQIIRVNNFSHCSKVSICMNCSMFQYIRELFLPSKDGFIYQINV